MAATQPSAEDQWKGIGNYLSQTKPGPTTFSAQATQSLLPLGGCIAAIAVSCGIIYMMGPSKPGIQPGIITGGNPPPITQQSTPQQPQVASQQQFQQAPPQQQFQPPQQQQFHQPPQQQFSQIPQQSMQGLQGLGVQNQGRGSGAPVIGPNGQILTNVPGLPGMPQSPHVFTMPQQVNK